MSSVTPQINPSQFLPDVPTDVSVQLQTLLFDMKSRLEQIYIDPTPPAGVTGLTVTANNLGNEVSWNAVARAASYNVWRNTSGTFATASLIDQLQGNGNISVFDPNDQTTANATRYYWVQPITASGVAGPLSAFVSGANFATSATGTALGTNATAAGTNALAAGQNASAAGPSDVALGVIAGTGSGSNNTAVGHGATTASGSTNNNTCVGESSAALKGNSTAIGQSANALSASDVVVGASSSTASNGGNNTIVGEGSVIQANTLKCTVVGQGITVFGTTTGLNTVIGQAAVSAAAANNATAVGQAANVGGPQDTIVGCTSSTSSGGGNVAVGFGAAVTTDGVTAAANAVMVGSGCTSTKSNSIAIGQGTSVSHTGCIVLGRQYNTVANNEIVFKSGAYTLKMPTTGGTANFVLQTDGTGITSWASGQSVAGLTTGSNPQFNSIGLNVAATTVAGQIRADVGANTAVAVLTASTATSGQFAAITLGQDSSGGSYKLGHFRYYNGAGVAANARIAVFHAGDSDSSALNIIGGGSIGIGTASPATSAAIDITSTTGALLVPRMTTTQKNALTASDGMIVYDTTIPAMQGRVSGAWITL